jgi:hypothetical protein
MVGHKKRVFITRIPIKQLSLYRRHLGLSNNDFEQLRINEQLVIAFSKAIDLRQSGQIDDVSRVKLCKILKLAKLC